MGLHFDVAPANIDETISEGADPAALAGTLAERKAAAIASKMTDAIVIGADTLCSIDGEVIGKPEDRGDAIRMLELLSGRRQSVITGVCIYDAARGRKLVDSDETVLRMLPMSREQILEYVATGRADGKAGAYDYRGENDPYVKSIEGSPTNIMGLPKELLRRMLSQWGIE